MTDSTAADQSAAARGLLAVFRGDDQRAKEQAAAELRQLLVDYAAVVLGSGRRRVDLDPESVVGSVIVRELPRAIRVCNDEDHLANLLRCAVRHKIYDRRGRKRPDDLFETALRRGPAVRQVGPATQAAHLESCAGDRRSYESLVAHLRAADLSDRERQLIELFVLQGLSWKAVAAQLGMSDGAAKTAMSRLRATVLPYVFEQLHEDLAQDEWTIARMLLVDRATPKTVAAEIGSSEDEVRRLFVDRILSHVMGRYGKRGLELLLLLIGKGGNSSD
jgi:DNA-directed RNA polymerase specialized sigma24 family protein